MKRITWGVYRRLSIKWLRRWNIRLKPFPKKNGCKPEWRIVSETIIGEQTLEQLSSQALQAMANYSQSAVGALYLNDTDQELSFCCRLCICAGRRSK